MKDKTQEGEKTSNFQLNSSQVYKGILPSGDQVAIKKAQASSQQGGAEFKTEIELLSRVHHKNLVGLLGFCLEEQMLVYELMPNGTLRDSLSGKNRADLSCHLFLLQLSLQKLNTMASFYY